MNKKECLEKPIQNHVKKVMNNMNVNTKPKFRLEDYLNKYVMHCDTRKKAEIFLRFLKKQAPRYWSIYKVSIDILKMNLCKEYHKDRCYNFIEMTYCNKKYYQEHGFQILEFDDFNWEK